MCGILFVFQLGTKKITGKVFEDALKNQGWRGPDTTNLVALHDGSILIGHNRLSIIDISARANQPMLSQNGRYLIAFNGEIYNHLELRKELGLQGATTSDTETILEGYAQLGEKIIDMLEGMFSLIIYDKATDTWISARDSLGIKPLYMHEAGKFTVIGSEPGVIAELCQLSVDELAVSEWKLARRPCPGASFFRGLREHPPGAIVRSDGSSRVYWKLEASGEHYEQEHFELLLRKSVTEHEISDVTNVALLSGGLDSAVITGLSKVRKAYSIGLKDNNEISGAKDTASTLNRELVEVIVSDDELFDTWKHLVRIRKEPLSVPNEGLIYLVCKRMKQDEKVVLTGEGADELLFGYDGIFRWALDGIWEGPEAFLRRYGYSVEEPVSERLLTFVEEEKVGKSVIEFLEDFFYKFHLPGLLRRMDFASMAASKESRVPFVSRILINYMYRRRPEMKISEVKSKLPLRELAASMNLQGALNRKKIGFSAKTSGIANRVVEYRIFQDTVLKELGWS